jgi:Ca2+-transporting ATPase
MAWHIARVGGVMGMAALALGYVVFHADNSAWQTMIFTTLGFLQIGQALASRSNHESFFKQGWNTNRTLSLMVGIVFVLQLIVIYVPFLDHFFGVEPLSILELGTCALVGSLAFIAIEIEKQVLRQRA